MEDKLYAEAVIEAFNAVFVHGHIAESEVREWAMRGIDLDDGFGAVTWTPDNVDEFVTDVAREVATARDGGTPSWSKGART